MGAICVCILLARALSYWFIERLRLEDLAVGLLSKSFNLARSILVLLNVAKNRSLEATLFAYGMRVFK